MAIAYASRFLNSLEEKYSVNELELLGVVWAIEHYKYYLYGKHFTVITDHQALISALNASVRSKTSQSRLTRWIDRLIPFHFDIKHLAGNKMGLIDYLSRNPVELAIPPSEYDEEFVVASIKTFINNLGLIDNVILNELANQNLAPCQLIRKRAEYKGTTINTSKLDLSQHSLKNSASGQLKKLKLHQFCSNHSANRSALSQTTNSRQSLPDCLKNSTNFVKFIHRHTIMNRKPDLKQYKGGFIPDEVKSLNPRVRKEEKLDNWQGTSDREESLSDPRLRKRPPMKKKAAANTSASTTTQINIKDARELISSRPPPVKNFPTITFTEENPQTEKQCVPKMKTTVAIQMDINKVLVGTQTELREGHPETNEVFVRRINFDIESQEECAPNEEPPSMSGTQSEAPQLEASHHEITEGIVATVNQTTMTEAEEETQLFRQRLQKVLGGKFIAAATKKDRNLRPLINFVKKRDWEAIKSAYGQYWFNVRNRLLVREDCLLIDERIVIPTQLRQTILESLHLTHPGWDAMLDLCQNVWFPHIHRSIVQIARTVQNKVKTSNQ